MRRLHHLPLRYLLLGVLGSFALLCGTGTYLMTVAQARQQVEQQASAALHADLHRLYEVVQLLLQGDNLEGARRIIATFGNDPKHDLTLLTAADGTVLAATRPALLGRRWTSSVSDGEQARITRLQAHGGLTVQLGPDGHSLAGYTALCETAGANALPPAACGFLYTQQHLSAAKAAAIQALRTQTLAHGAGVLLIAVLLWSGLHLLVTRRVERLIATAQRVTAGDVSARTDLRGRDELARVGQEMDTMTQTLGRIYHESEAQRARLSTLVAMTQRLTRGLTLPTVLHGIADAAAQVFGGEAGFRLRAGEWLVRTGATPGAHAAMVHERVQLGASLSGRVALHNQALMTADIAADTRVLPAHRAAASPERLGALLCLPVGIDARVVGTLHIYRERGHVFSEEERALATSLAAQAAIAIDNAQLFGALQAREERMRAVVDTAVEGIITINEHGIIDTYNAAAARLFGYPAAEVVGQNMRLLMPAPYRDAHDAYLQRYLATGERKIIGLGREVVGLHRDGSTFPMHLAVSEMWVEGQRMFTGLVSDISAYKAAEAALHEANEALEQRVAARTAALQEANEEIKRFAYIVSHDLRAPLVNLKGFAGELRLSYGTLAAALTQAWPQLPPEQAADLQRVLQQEIPEALEFIDASVTRMDTLVRAILQLSRFGRRELDIEEVDMAALMQETLHAMAHQVAQRQVQVCIDPLPTVQADRTAMAQVMGNLFANAVYYLDPGRPGVITIRGVRQSTTTAFAVCDNGRGIAPDDIPKVFEPFRRVGRQDVPGEGMGLAYVRALVRRHGGEITCQSTLGVGSTFTFTIAHRLPEGGLNA